MGLPVEWARAARRRGATSLGGSHGRLDREWNALNRAHATGTNHRHYYDTFRRRVVREVPEGDPNTAATTVETIYVGEDFEYEPLYELSNKFFFLGELRIASAASTYVSAAL